MTHPLAAISGSFWGQRLALDGVLAIDELIISLTFTMCLLQWPWPVVSLDVDFIRGVSSLPSSAELPVQGIVGVVAIAAVHDPLERVLTLVLVEVGRVLAELHVETVLIRRSLEKSLLPFPANFMFRHFDVIAESLYVLVHFVACGVTFATFLLPALELFRDGARLAVLTEDLGTEIDSFRKRKRGNRLMSELVGMEEFAERVR